MFLRAYRKVIILASDTPQMLQDVIRSAIARLDEIDMVLGHCDDEGYYLIGLHFRAPTLSTGIPWSTSQVLNRTIQCAQEAGMTWELLPPGYDIDTREDAKRLCKDLEGNSAGDSDRCLRTKKSAQVPGFLTCCTDDCSLPVKFTQSTMYNKIMYISVLVFSLYCNNPPIVLTAGLFSTDRVLLNGKQEYSCVVMGRYR